MTFIELLNNKIMHGSLCIVDHNNGAIERILEYKDRGADALVTDKILVSKGLDEKYLNYYVKEVSWTDVRQTLIILTNNIKEIN